MPTRMPRQFGPILKTRRLADGDTADCPVRDLAYCDLRGKSTHPASQQGHGRVRFQEITLKIAYNP